MSTLDELRKVYEGTSPAPWEASMGVAGTLLSGWFANSPATDRDQALADAKFMRAASIYWPLLIGVAEAALRYYQIEYSHAPREELGHLRNFEKAISDLWNFRKPAPFP